MTIPMHDEDSLPFSPLDHHFAACLRGLCPDMDILSERLAREASAAASVGAVCLDLTRLAGQSGRAADERWPELAEMQRILENSPVVGVPGQFRPLILDGERLYLARYWDYESRLALALRQRANRCGEHPDLDDLRRELAQCFPEPTPASERQKLAAALAVLNRLCVISGGPGTGKTSTVIRILAVLQALHGGSLRIGLVAPTGKAAARLTESIRSQKSGLSDHPWVDAIPEVASTIHRLLGSRPDSVYFKHGKDRPLGLDVVVLDEASMVDLALMAKLIDAIPLDARFILLGDKDQLDAVEAGSVFGDLCASCGYSEALLERLHALGNWSDLPVSAATDAMSDCVVLLTHSYRFGADSGIGHLARSINAGEIEASVALLADDRYPDLSWQGDVGRMSDEALKTRMVTGFGEYFRAVDEGELPATVFQSFNRFRILTAHREGRDGAAGCNAQIEAARRQRLGVSNRAHWYPGRAVMIRRNDYGLRLFNGDIGICLAVDGELRVWFESGDGGMRSLAPGRVPEHDGAFAMTVHKSQGSEFDDVLLLLPDGVSPVADRPLMYTGITRARRRVEISGPLASFQSAVARLPAKPSGLADRLR